MQMLAEGAGEVDGNTRWFALLVDHLKRRVSQLHADAERARPFRTAGGEREEGDEKEAEKGGISLEGAFCAFCASLWQFTNDE